MTANEKKALRINACKVRMGIIEGTYAAKSGHPGGSLSSADLFTYLYFRELNVDPAQPDKPERDRFVLSKGHCAPGWYGALAQRGRGKDGVGHLYRRVRHPFCRACHSACRAALRCRHLPAQQYKQHHHCRFKGCDG